MMNLNEIREMPESRRLFRLFAAAAVLWLLFFILLYYIAAAGNTIKSGVASGDRVLSAAAIYTPSAAPGTARTVSDADTMTVVTDILDTLELRSRAIQLQSNASGVSLNLERVYGSEMQEFLSTLESRGLRIRNAELKSLPAGDERVLGAVLLLEPNR